MINRNAVLFLSILTLFMLVVSCAPKPAETAPAVAPPAVTPKQTVTPKPSVPAPTEEALPATGESSVDDVAMEITESSNADNELDTAEVGNVDDILSDIEGI